MSSSWNAELDLSLYICLPLSFLLTLLSFFNISSLSKARPPVSQHGAAKALVPCCLCWLHCVRQQVCCMMHVSSFHVLQLSCQAMSFFNKRLFFLTTLELSTVYFTNHFNFGESFIIEQFCSWSIYFIFKVKSLSLKSYFWIVNTVGWEKNLFHIHFVLTLESVL